MSHIARSWQLLPCVLAFCAAPCVVGAQGYPSKPVRYIVPSSPGSAVDTIGRVVAAALGEALGQQIVVDNRAGAGGNIGAAAAASAAPDGYTLLQVNNNHTTNVTLYRKRGYDLLKDFVPVTQLATSSYVVVVNPSLPVKSIGALIKLAKARPGEITYASAGVGSGTFMAGTLLRQQSEADMLHVPYVGGGPAITAVVSGEAMVYAAPLATSLPMIHQGRLRALALTSGKRLPILPDYPTVGETIPGFQFDAWVGLVIPAATPPEIVSTVRDAAIAALGKPNVVKRLTDLGYVVTTSEPAEFAAYMKADIGRMAKLIRENNVRPR